MFRGIEEGVVCDNDVTVWLNKLMVYNDSNVAWNLGRVETV